MLTSVVTVRAAPGCGWVLWNAASTRNLQKWHTRRSCLSHSRAAGPRLGMQSKHRTCTDSSVFSKSRHNMKPQTRVRQPGSAFRASDNVMCRTQLQAMLGGTSMTSNARAYSLRTKSRSRMMEWVL